MPSPPSIHIRTPGYWPLPRFVKLHDGKKWMALQAKTLGEKEAKYGVKGAMGILPGFLILEAEITNALPKKLHLHLGKRRLILSRWIGGLYSNLRASSPQRSVRSFYDAIAPRYHYHVEPGRGKQLLALVSALVPLLPKNAKVLDASAGDCTLAKAAKSAGLGLEIWCNDISGKMLALGHDAVLSSRRSISSASRLPFPASSFDAVIHSYSNIHPSDRRFFRSFTRVLKPNGLLLYHPVKAPGEQWPQKFEEKTRAALLAAGFSQVERHIAHAKGARRVSTLVFYLSRK